MRRLAAMAVIACAPAFAQGQGESEHVPPDPPQSRVHAMPYGDMADMMGMDDRRSFDKVMLNRLEWQRGDASGRFGWDAAAWYGGDFNKLWLETEGEHAAGNIDDARLELLWDRIVTPWWSVRAGWRHDSGIGPSRDWVAFGVAGLAPGFIEIQASLYLGADGRTALRLTTEHDLLITQRLVLQPEAELNAYSRDDPSDLRLGLRLRYEWRRELAPYLGVRWIGHFGDSADEFEWLAGVRAWF